MGRDQPVAPRPSSLVLRRLEELESRVSDRVSRTSLRGQLGANWYNHGTGQLWTPFLSSRLSVSIFCRILRVPWKTRADGSGGLFTVLVPFSARVLGFSWDRPEEMGRGWFCPCGLPRAVFALASQALSTTRLADSTACRDGVVGSTVYQGSVATVRALLRSRFSTRDDV